MKSKKIWVVWWHYGDWSCAGLTGAYESREMAARDADLLNEHSTVEHEVSEIPFFEASFTPLVTMTEK